MAQKAKANQPADHPDLEARHPSGVPRTIDSIDDDGSITYADEVGGHSAAELKQLGYSDDEIAKMEVREDDEEEKPKRGTRE